MSSTKLSETDKINKKPFHRRNDSAELDVFEASRYFSGINESWGSLDGPNSAQKFVRENRGARISLEVFPPHSHNAVEKQMKEKKHKQPSSPGGRLASFLNSLFTQTSSKKKKSKSTTTQSMKDEDESGNGGRRRRRSSISHFRSTDSKSLYSSSSSGFRTPPPYANTPIKCFKDLRSYSDHKQVSSMPKYNVDLNGHVKSSEVLEDKQKLNGFLEKPKNSGNGFLEKHDIWKKEKEFKKLVDEVDDGAESDSSSDLFELQNFDLGYYSSGLPVYETTHMENIKKGSPMTN